MNLRLSIDACLLFFLLLPFASHARMFHFLSFESTQTQDSSLAARSVLMSDREKAGLHGPVKTCVDEIIDSHSYKHSTSSEYGLDGRLLTSHIINPDGSQWIRTQVYDESGRLAKLISGRVGEPATESLYTYDELGRPLTITNYPQKEGRMDFHYDEHGRKIATQTFDPETLRRVQNASYVGSRRDAAMSVGVGVPVGGKIVTTYGENDKPTELQIRDDGEQVVSRMVSTYDANSLLIAEKPFDENPIRMMLDRMPDEQRSQLSPEQLKQMNQQLGVLMAGKEQAGTSYEYDAQGRITKLRSRDAFVEETTTTLYNFQGDKAEERTTYADNSVLPVGVPHSIGENGVLVPSKPVAKAPESALVLPERALHYAYQYDSYGNWVKQTVTPGPSSSEPVRVQHRKLTYY
jgi:hypothetical protein